MIHVDVQPGSPEWRKARAGIPTASAADKILTAKTLKPSAQAGAYMNHLLAEWLLGHPLDDGRGSLFMERGVELEAEAAAYFDMERGVDSEIAGFLLRDDRRMGCSPDRLVGNDAGLEIKCPSAAVHVGYLLDKDALVQAYRGQVQGSLYVTGRKVWSLLSYNPAMPSVLVDVEPDEDYIAALQDALEAFHVRLDAAKAQLAEARDAAYAEDPLL